MASVHDIVHDGVLYARSVWRACLWGTSLHVPTLIDQAQQHELRHLATVMASAVDRQCKSAVFILIFKYLRNMEKVLRFLFASYGWLS